MNPIGVVLVLVAGLLAGAVVGGVLARRRAVRSTQRAVDAALVAAGLGPVGSSDDPSAAVVRAVRDVARVASESTGVQALLADVLEGFPCAVMVFGPDGTVEVVNAAGSRLLDARHTEAIVARAVRELLAEGGTRTVELAGPPPQCFDVAVRPLSGGHSLAIVEDVTERRRLEAVRRDFVANISHELRTPVGAIAVLAETMRDEGEVDVLTRLAGKVHREALRVTDALEDLLELSRIESVDRPAFEPVPVCSLVDDAFGRVTQSAEARGVQLVRAVGPGVVTVTCDRRQVVSALVNLLDNAVKYSEPSSTVTLRVDADADAADGPGGEVVFVVEDRGIGIPARDLERVFERFYRVDRARSRTTGGTGLGLAIVRHVAENHAGRVGVTSTEGVGSRFELRLPVGPVGVATEEVS